ncbi:MAG TPA: PH domain-containing protein [Beutenbergiaceae bacterium]|nr:PH domain-containing protein [Beutenbergiaceae bacterium]
MTTPSEEDVTVVDPPRRVSPITPLLEAWKAATALIAFAVWQGRGLVQDANLSWLVMGGVFVAVVFLSAVLSLVYNFFAWRRLSYGFDADSVYVHSGILFRSQRHVRLDRIQAVNLLRPVVARIFGFVAVQVTSAGSGQVNLVIAYVSDRDGDQLRQEILTRAHGQAPDLGPSGEDQAPQREVLRVPPRRIIGSLVRSTGLIVTTIVVALVVMGAIVARDPSIIVAMLVPTFAQGTYWWQRLNQQFDFTVATDSDGIRLRYGLFSTVARTVPPGRVQAIGLTQPVLWRRKNWWRVTLTVAGEGSTSTGDHSVLCPVATQTEVESLMELVHQDLGVLAPADLLDAAMHGRGQGHQFVTSPKRAWILDPLVWRRTGYRAASSATLIRRGRITKRAMIVPHARIQSLGMGQGPIQRALSLANVEIHLTPGPVAATVPHLGADRAQEFIHVLSEYGRISRHSPALPAHPGAEAEIPD